MRPGRAGTTEVLSPSTALTPPSTSAASAPSTRAASRSRPGCRRPPARRDVGVLGSWLSGASGPMLWIDHLGGDYQLTLGTTGLDSYLDSGQKPVVGQWQNVAAAIDGSTARYYIDGTQVASRSVTYSVGSSNAWRIGAHGSSPGGFFDGLIDNVRVYNRALSATEVQNDMNCRGGGGNAQPSTHCRREASPSQTGRRRRSRCSGMPRQRVAPLSPGTTSTSTNAGRNDVGDVVHVHRVVVLHQPPAGGGGLRLRGERFHAHSSRRVHVALRPGQAAWSPPTPSTTARATR